MLSIESIEKTSNGSLKIWLIKQLGEFFRDFVINNIVNPTALTKSCYNIKRFVDDRICVPFLGLRFLSNLLKSFEYIKKTSGTYVFVDIRFKYPVLMLHGVKDRICDPKQAMQFYRDIASETKTKIWYTEGFHEPFSDFENDKYKSDILKWLSSRVEEGKIPGKKPILLGKVREGRIGVEGSKKWKRKGFVLILVFALYIKGIFL